MKTLVSSHKVPTPAVPRRLKLALIGGPEVQLRLALAEYLVQDFDLYVLGSSRSAGPIFKHVGVDYRPYPMTRGINPWRDFITLLCLRRHLRSIRPDLVHTYDSKPCALGRIAAWIGRVPVIIGTYPGMGSLYGSNRLRIRLVRVIYEVIQALACRVSTLSIVQNADDLEDFISRGVMLRSKTIIVRGSGVNTRAFRPDRLAAQEAAKLRQSLGLSATTLVVTMVSRVIRSKGVLEFAAAADQLRKTEPRAHFVLIGQVDAESPDRLNARELATLRHSVHWLGRRDDIAELLCITDVFVLPTSLMEGIPRVLLEAAASGLPIVTSDTRGCRDVVEHGKTGLLIKPGDSVELSHAILSLLGDPVRRSSLGKEARRRVIQEFDSDLIYGQLTRVYREQMGGARS